MNRGNIWIHVGLATILIALAAILGQLDRWRGALQTTREKYNVQNIKPQAPIDGGVPECSFALSPERL
jgi:hypothetical protein